MYLVVHARLLCEYDLPLGSFSRSSIDHFVLVRPLCGRFSHRIPRPYIG